MLPSSIESMTKTAMSFTYKSLHVHVSFSFKIKVRFRSHELSMVNFTMS